MMLGPLGSKKVSPFWSCLWMIVDVCVFAQVMIGVIFVEDYFETFRSLGMSSTSCRPSTPSIWVNHGTPKIPVKGKRNPKLWSLVLFFWPSRPYPFWFSFLMAWISPTRLTEGRWVAFVWICSAAVCSLEDLRSICSFGLLLAISYF